MSRAITALRLTPVMFELGARPHPPRDLYRAYLAQSDVFVGIYGAGYGWVAPGETVSGLEDEYLLSGTGPKLIYVKTATDREPRLHALLERVQADDRAAYQPFEQAAEELAELLADDLAVLLTERFAAPAPTPPDVLRPGPPAGAADAGSSAARRGAGGAWPRCCTGPDVRLVTLVGPGGIGKTRLALEVARAARRRRPGSLRAGVVRRPGAGRATPPWWSSCDREPPSAYGRRAARPILLDLLVDRLPAGRVLLVLDNFEQVLSAAAAVAALLAACPDRHRCWSPAGPCCGCAASTRPLVPLATPLAGRARPAAVDRYPPCSCSWTGPARSGPASTPTAADAPRWPGCAARLDGIPLALELAAAQLRMLPPAVLLRRLGDRLDRPLDLAAGPVDLPDRQRTLRATIEWSHDLLAPAERALLDRLSVFAGTFTLAAAEAVAGTPGEDLARHPVLAGRRRAWSARAARTRTATRGSGCSARSGRTRGSGWTSAASGRRRCAG